MKDPRLVERQKFIIEQIKELTEILQEDTDNIDWEKIARIGNTITTTSLTADMLANAHRNTCKSK